MNILFTRFPLESLFGGAEVQTLSLMRGLSARGHHVSFLGSCPVLLDEGAKQNVSTTSLEIGPPPVSMRHALSFFWRKRAMQKKVTAAMQQQGRPDVICMLSLSEKILLTPFALEQGLKVIWIEHDSVGRWLNKNPWLCTLTKLSARVTTVCVSELSAELYRNLGYENVRCIPNGVEKKQWDTSDHNSDQLVIGCIARLNPEKGVHVLIEAVEHIPNVRLLINGRGDQNIPDAAHIQHIERVDNIDEIYQQIDVLVLPSISNDPFGLVVAEAMLRNIPVICTTACGISKYLHSGVDGLVVKADSVVALRDAIEMMQDTETRNRIAESGKHTAEKHFTLERMVDQYEELFSV